jgi:PAS domain S-box-containing protein
MKARGSVDDLERQVFDELPDAVIATTAEGRILFWNRGAESIFGYSSDEAAGRSLSKLIVPADRIQEEEALIREAINNGGSIRETLRCRKDGSLVYVDVSTRAIHANGKLWCVLSTEKDVTLLKVERDARLIEAKFRDLLEALESPEPEANLTELTALQGYSKVLVKKLEHRNAELQLAKEELLRTNSDLVSRTNELQTAKASVESTARQLQSLFDNLDDVFFSLDMEERRLVQISPSCEKLYGLPPHAFFANPMLWKDLTLTADRNLIEQGVADLHAGKPWNGEHRIQRPGGGSCWVQSKLKPVLDHTGALVRIDGVVSDISERKNLEGQLLHSQKLEAVGRLAGGVAHDFNNLLVVILGYADLAMGHLASDDPLRFQMEEVKAAGERATGLTRQLLAFSRKQILDPQILDLNALVTDAERWLKRLIGEDIELTTDNTGGSRIEAHPGGFRAGGPGHPQPCRQCPRRHAEWRKTDDRNGQRGTRQRIRAAPRNDPPGKVRDAGCKRHWLWHESGSPVAHLRAFFHHEGARERHGTRACHGLWNCRAE